MDIENSPGAQAGPQRQAARERGSREREWHSLERGGLNDVRVCGLTHSGRCPETRAARLVKRGAEGVLWCHAASTSKIAAMVAATGPKKGRDRLAPAPLRRNSPPPFVERRALALADCLFASG